MGISKHPEYKASSKKFQKIKKQSRSFICNLSAELEACNAELNKVNAEIRKSMETKRDIRNKMIKIHEQIIAEGLKVKTASSTHDNIVALLKQDMCLQHPEDPSDMTEQSRLLILDATKEPSESDEDQDDMQELATGLETVTMTQ